MVEHDGQSLEPFDILLPAARVARLTFSGSESTKPVGGLPIHGPGGTRVGTVSLFYFSGQGASLEFDFTRMARISEEELPVASMQDLFLQQLSDIPGLEGGG